MANITKDMLISEAVRQGNSEAIAAALMDAGMHCLGCAFARGETVEQAAAVHGIDIDELVERLNEAAES